MSKVGTSFLQQIIPAEIYVLSFTADDNIAQTKMNEESSPVAQA